MVAFTYRMPSGIPGQLNRAEQCHTEPNIIMATNPPLAYGLPVVLDAGTKQIRPVGAGDTADMVAGFNVRPWPTTPGSYANQGLGTGTPMGSGVVDVLRRGYMMVQLNGVTAAAKGGKVYVRVASPAAGKPIGGLEAAADGANTIVLDSSCYFMGPSDAQGNTEIAFNI